MKVWDRAGIKPWICSQTRIFSQTRYQLCYAARLIFTLVQFSLSGNVQGMKPGPEVIKLFSCSTQLSTKFILLINVKMTTIVGISTFISILNTSEHLKARKVFIFMHFKFYTHLKFHAQLSWHEKCFITSGPVKDCTFHTAVHDL